VPSGAGRGAAASARLISTEALAPSDSCEALPAVMNSPSGTHWPFFHTGLSAARLSSVVSARLPSSRCQRHASVPVRLPSLSNSCLTLASGTISSSNRPAACAAAVRCWLRSAYSSCAAREMP
jgi:hypothetical protein